MLTKPTGRLGSASLAAANKRLEVGPAGIGVGLGLVGQAPEDDARMVLVPRNQLLDGLSMDVLGGGADRLLGIGRPRAAEEHAAPDAEVEPDRSRLVDDDDALAVGVLEHLLGVGVVGGAERVGADPGEQGEVVHHGGVVVTAAVDVEVLVLAEAPEVEGLAVDEELRALDPHGADADGKRVAVDDGVAVDQLDLAGRRGTRGPGPRAPVAARAGRRRRPPPRRPRLPSASRSRTRTVASPASTTATA